MSFNVFLLILGVLLVFFGTYTFKCISSFSSKVKNCTEVVKGKIISFENTQKRRDRKIIYTFYPVMEYSLDGVVHRNRSTSGIESLGGIDNYHVNDEIDLMVNPNNPSDFVFDISIYRNKSIEAIVYFVFTACFFIISLIKFGF